jgi:FLYWCH zinc finger domain
MFRSISDFDISNLSVNYIIGFRGCKKLKVGDYTFTRNKENGYKVYWSCARAGLHKCKARVVTSQEDGEQHLIVKHAFHNHVPF